MAGRLNRPCWAAIAAASSGEGKSKGFVRTGVPLPVEVLSMLCSANLVPQNMR